MTIRRYGKLTDEDREFLRNRCKPIKAGDWTARFEGYPMTPAAHMLVRRYEATINHLIERLGVPLETVVIRESDKDEDHWDSVDENGIPWTE